MKNIFVTQPSIVSFEEYSEEIRELWNTKWLTNMGIKHNRLQEILEAYLDVDHVELLVNGHMALEMTLQAMDLEGEVITTPFTFASTTHAIVRNGLTPVFCDIREDDFTLDASKIEQLITEKTCAILPVHVYGNICDVDEIDRIAKKYNLKVIYDAAHAFGEKYNGVGVGNFGDASCFSFHATKVFNTVEGGAVSYKDEDLGKKLYGLKNFGIRGPENIDSVGANAKMNEFCAAMGICNIRHISEEIEKRKEKDKRYRDNLCKIKGIRLNPLKKDDNRNYAYFPIVVEKDYKESRDDLFNRLIENEIFARKYFYPIASKFGCYDGMFDSCQTPTALDISNRIITLPIYADLTFEEIDFICDIISRKNM